jgi:hypothetical protein
MIKKGMMKSVTEIVFRIKWLSHNSKQNVRSKWLLEYSRYLTQMDFCIYLNMIEQKLYYFYVGIRNPKKFVQMTAKN